MHFFRTVLALAGLAGLPFRHRGKSAVLNTAPHPGNPNVATTAPLSGWWIQRQSPESIYAHVERAKQRRMNRALRRNPSAYSIRNAADLLAAQLPANIQSTGIAAA